MVLIAALAIGVGAVRLHVRMFCAHGHYGLLSIQQPRLLLSPRHLVDEGPVLLSIGYILNIILCGSVILLTLVRSPGPWNRLMRQPGIVGCFTALFVFVGAMLKSYLHEWTRTNPLEMYYYEQIFYQTLDVVSFSTAAVWLVMILGGRF
jgi:hypothetical protein